MRVLVTGGAGFIGSHLVRRLLDDGHEVLCLDNFFTGKRQNLAEVREHPSLEIIRHDVIEPISLEIDQVYNLACPASPVHYQFDPVRTVQTSVMGAINMLGLCRRTGARLLQASTSEVYGLPTVHPQPESYVGNVNPIGTRSCYDEGKRVAETLCMDYHRENDVSVRVVRIFNTYGPRLAMCDGRVIPSFICQALKGEPITLHGDGLQTRSFCYVDDTVDGLIALMNDADPAFTGPVNLGNDTETNMKELAEIIIELTGSRSTIEHLPVKVDDPTRRRPDLSLARSRVGYVPRVPLREGLQRTVAYFAQLLGLESGQEVTRR